MFKKFLFIILIIQFSTSLAWQTEKFDSLITAGVHRIYDIQFDDAEKTFSEVRTEFPQHPAGNFFDAMIIWWKIMLDMNNESYDEIFMEKIENVIEQCDEILDREPENVDAIFFKGGSLGFRGRLYSIRESWFNAALDGKEALPLVHEAYKYDSDNPDVQLGFGIYNYYAAVIPQKYPFVKPFMIFFPPGDRKQGLEQLKNVEQNGKYARVESRYILMTVMYKLEENYLEAENYAKLLVEEFPNNPTFQKYYGRINIKKGNYDFASDIFSDVLEKSDRGLPGYNKKLRREAMYYIAMDYKIKNDLESAADYFKECENLSRDLDADEESGFLINSVLYLGMIYDKTGNRSLALENYNDVLDFREYQNSHELAERYRKSPYQ